MRHWASIVLLLVLCRAGAAQVNVHLRGMGDNLAGREVELYCYEDMLTMTERLLDRNLADSAGNFELGCYITYPRLVFVQVENYSQSFYIEPGRDYNVYLPEFRWEQDEERNLFLDPVALPLRFLDLPADELNLRIARFDEEVDSFIRDHRVFFDPRFKPDRAWMDSLERHMDTAARAEKGGTSFFDRYAEFTLAEMRFAMRFASRRQMFERHIAGQPVLYHDENYMRLLLSLTDGMVSLGTRKLPKWRLEEWVAGGDLDSYIDSLGTDPLLADEQLREMAALVALKESYYDASYSRDGVRTMVSRIATESKFAEHRRLATLLGQSFNRAEEGSAMQSGVTLPDADRNMVCLDSMLGKWVYISFVRVGDPNCQRELETMAHFRDSVYAQGDVEFVSISCDREFQKMFHFLRNNRHGARYRWTWLHFDGDYRMLERFGVVSYPTFVLINPEGKLHYSVTPAPESGIFLNAPWRKQAEAERPTLPFLRQD